ncbi:MAG: penicillin-insensitive murein endopeptidase [Deltaproteobacteria bacterium]|nr:penicillin-insensitive murein endopeptidase [Deltaproteobacteria bacterium]
MADDPVSALTATTATRKMVAAEECDRSTASTSTTAAGVVRLPPAKHCGRIPERGGLPLPAPAMTSSSASRSLEIPLAATVGTRATNRTDDVRVIQKRLAELGFPVKADGVFRPEVSRYLKIFASMCAGREQWTDLADKVAANNDLGRALFHKDAPRWVEVAPGGPGWVSIDRDGYNWGAAKTLEVVDKAGQRYQKYLDKQASGSGVRIMVNDISRKQGTVLAKGKGIPEHQTHRNGLDIDLRLPKKGGDAVQQIGTHVGWADYDRDTMFVMIEAFASQPEVERILFNDPKLLERAKRESKPWADKLVLDNEHIHHAHVDIVPPRLER